MREKLINLLSTAGWNLYTSEQAKQEIADHLIKNGVTIPVRCKECEHGIDEEYKNLYVCSACPDGLGGYIDGNSFCSQGKRKEKQ